MLALALAPALAMAMAQQAAAARQSAVLVNRVGPSSSALYIANVDGSSERPLLADGQFEYDASFSSDGQWIVFTSERNGSSDIYRARVARVSVCAMKRLCTTAARSRTPNCS